MTCIVGVECCGIVICEDVTEADMTLTVLNDNTGVSFVDIATMIEESFEGVL